MSHTRVLAIIVAIAALIPAEAARLPEWARPIAASAPPVPEGIAEYSQRTLLDEQLQEVQDDGTIRIRRRVALQALTQLDPSVGVDHSSYGLGVSVESVAAWHLLPAGRGKVEKRDEGDAVDLGGGDSFFSDKQARWVGFGQVKRGSLVFFEFVVLVNQRYFGGSVPFFDINPTDRQRLIVRLPAGWSLVFDWINGSPIEPKIEGSSYTWELLNPAPIEFEAQAAEPSDRFPRLLFTAIPPAGVAPKVVSFSSWDQFAARYSRDIAPLSEPDEAIKREAARAAADLDWFAKVRAIAVLVRNDVRYVSKAFGTAGYIPRASGETFSSLWGDCKDKGTLLRAMLTSQGIESYVTLIGMNGRYNASDRVAVNSRFDHFIVAVVAPPDVTLPSYAASAILQDPTLGRLLFIDVTNDLNSIGSMSPALAGERAFVAAPNNGHLVTTPGLNSNAHRIESALRLNLSPSGAVVYERRTSHFGGFAEEVRAAQRTSLVEREKFVKQTLRLLWIGADISDYKAEVETGEGASVEEIKWRLAEPPTIEREKKILIFPRARTGFSCVSLTGRKTPVVYAHPMLLTIDTDVATLPPDTRLPNTKSQHGDGWQVTTTYLRQGAGMKAHFELRLDKTEFALDELDSLNSLCRAASAAADAALYVPID